MDWGNPRLLLLLWLLPVLVTLLFYAQRRKRQAAARLFEANMRARLMPDLRGPRRWWKGLALLLGLAAAILALARPRFGTRFEEVVARGLDLSIVLDVSRSMLAEDIAPNRLERAKFDIQDVLEQLRGDRAGLIVFAGRPVVKVPLTTDHGFFRQALEEVDTQSAPRGGSLIGDALRKSLETMKPAHDRDQVVLLITDGEDQDSYPLEAAEAAAERGVKVIAVGLGDPREGARIPLQEKGSAKGYVEHAGQQVWSKLDEELLRSIALKTGGTYIPAATRAYDLGERCREELAELRRAETRGGKRERRLEQYQWFAFTAVVFLLGESLVAPCRTQAYLESEKAA